MLYTRLLVIALTLISATVNAEQNTADARELVEMPIETQQFIRQKMVENLGAVNAILIALDNEDWSTIETVANKTIAKRGGMQLAPKFRPGMYMPAGMRQIGQSLHQSADALIVASQQKDVDASRKELQNIVNSCVACHSSYRIR